MYKLKNLYLIYSNPTFILTNVSIRFCIARQMKFKSVERLQVHFNYFAVGSQWLQQVSPYQYNTNNVYLILLKTE